MKKFSSMFIMTAVTCTLLTSLPATSHDYEYVSDSSRPNFFKSALMAVGLVAMPTLIEAQKGPFQGKLCQDPQLVGCCVGTIEKYDKNTILTKKVLAVPASKTFCDFIRHDYSDNEFKNIPMNISYSFINNTVEINKINLCDMAFIFESTSGSCHVPNASINLNYNKNNCSHCFSMSYYTNGYYDKDGDFRKRIYFSDFLSNVTNYGKCTAFSPTNQVRTRMPKSKHTRIAKGKHTGVPTSFPTTRRPTVRPTPSPTKPNCREIRRAAWYDEMLQIQNSDDGVHGITYDELLSIQNGRHAAYLRERTGRPTQSPTRPTSMPTFPDCDYGYDNIKTQPPTNMRPSDDRDVDILFSNLMTNGLDAIPVTAAYFGIPMRYYG